MLLVVFRVRSAFSLRPLFQLPCVSCQSALESVSSHDSAPFFGWAVSLRDGIKYGLVEEEMNM